MVERTEEQKLTQSPIIIVLGEKEYEVKPLVIKDSRMWRAEVAKLLGSLSQYTGITTDTPDKFMEAMQAMLVAMPDAVVNLVFSYAKSLDREAIECVATDAEMARAFNQIIEVAFPLARSVIGAMTSLSR